MYITVTVTKYTQIMYTLQLLWEVDWLCKPEHIKYLKVYEMSIDSSNHNSIYLRGSRMTYYLLQTLSIWAFPSETKTQSLIFCTWATKCSVVVALSKVAPTLSVCCWTAYMYKIWTQQLFYLSVYCLYALHDESKSAWLYVCVNYSNETTEE